MVNTETVDIDEPHFVVSDLPPSPVQKRLALLVVLGLIVIFIITVGPLSSVQPPTVVAFVPAYTTALVVNDAITATLLYSQFAILRTHALLVLSSGYLFTALITVPFVLTFPGVFGATSLIGGLQSTPFLYFLWHAGFSMFVIGYALLKDPGPNRGLWVGSAGTGIALSIVLTTAIVAALAFLCVADEARLPRLQIDPLHLASQWLFFAGLVVLSFIIALIVVWIRRRSVLDLWLMVVMCAYTIELLLSYFPASARYSIGWYGGRLYSLLASSLVLFVLLYEITALYARLLRAVLEQRREREARLATGTAIAATIAHEIRQPLSGIVTNADAGLNWLNRPIPDLNRAKATFKQIITDGGRAGAVIQSVQAIFKRDVQNRTYLDIKILIREALAAASEDIKKHKISIQTESIGSLQPIFGDRIQLQQVFLNLITNAIDAMASKDGKRVLRVRAESNEAGSVLVSVADTGTGVPSSDIERIFDPLFTTKPNGMGMGLSICRSIIGAHGGRLTVGPNAPEGTVFQFVLHSDAATVERTKSKSAIRAIPLVPTEPTS